jgi:predicted AAA+ superfamily ATPase
MIHRIVSEKINTNFDKGKAIIVIGARQVGKSTLLKMLISKENKKILFWDGDEPDIRLMLENATSDYLRQQIGQAEILVIDEAQHIKNIGITLKLVVDKIPHVQLLVSGSSAFELANEINEPLTGRKFEYQLMALSSQELVNHHGILHETRMLNHRLVYGFYPEIVTKAGEEQINLRNLANSYLYKDIFNFQDVRKPEIFQKLLSALALQIGNEISYHELALTTGSDSMTIQRYIDLLEKSYIVFRLPSLSRNVRTELRKSRKVYFYDNGIRNAILGDYRTPELRNDIGSLWENFLVSERMKYLEFNGIQANKYFWRTAQQQEIDYIEEKEGTLFAYEFKWNPIRKVLFPKTFIGAYPNTETQVITRENYMQFLLPG